MHRGLAETIAAFSRGLSECRRPEDRALVESYQATLAPVLARAVLGETVLRELDQVERLFGHTWLVGAAPFDDALKKWRQFRDEYERWALGGMTVNERLVELGLSNAYDEACLAKKSAEVRRLLERIRVDEESIAAIVGKL